MTTTRTDIEWTDVTWNPVTGCDRVSAGCANCYALTLSRRLKAMGSRRYQRDGAQTTSGPGFGVTLHPDLLERPFSWPAGSRVFVNSMSDLFHDQVPVEFIQSVFEVMLATPDITYQVLTKRSARMQRLAHLLPWPRNLWMGVSVETQKYITRAMRLTQIPASVRFLSVEPLLAPLDFSMAAAGPGPLTPVLERVHWVIVGGETGPRCRPCDLDWIRGVRDQCQAMGVPVFVKQLGASWARTSGPGRGKGADPATWPEDLRVRELPARWN